MKTFEKYISYALTLVFPGLGHYYCGKKLSAACIAVSVGVLFLAGVLLGAPLEFETINRNMMGVFGLSFIYVRVVPIMASLIKICSGVILFFPAAALQKTMPALTQNIPAMREEIATAFCLTAGLLNLLTFINLFYWHNRDLLAALRGGHAAAAAPASGEGQAEG